MFKRMLATLFATMLIISCMSSYVSEPRGMVDIGMPENITIESSNKEPQVLDMAKPGCILIVSWMENGKRLKVPAFVVGDTDNYWIVMGHVRTYVPKTDRHLSIEDQCRDPEPKPKINKHDRKIIDLNDKSFTKI